MIGILLSKTGGVSAITDGPIECTQSTAWLICDMIVCSWVPDTTEYPGSGEAYSELYSQYVKRDYMPEQDRTWAKNGMKVHMSTDLQSDHMNADLQSDHMNAQVSIAIYNERNKNSMIIYTLYWDCL